MRTITVLDQGTTYELNESLDDWHCTHEAVRAITVPAWNTDEPDRVAIECMNPDCDGIEDYEVHHLEERAL